ncbi:hypothetical protein LTR17_025840 [Elasticomyces elasticus]|nr:hypothetical protein LTR17_025840 [Elasticomyces elasticus]
MCACLVFLCLEAGLVSSFASPVPADPDRASIGAAVAALYLFTFSYGIGIDTTLWVYCAEIFANHLRSRGIAVCILSFCLTGLILLQVAATAFADIGWRFFLIFICVCALGLIWLRRALPETSFVPLEEIAAIFGHTDQVAVFSAQIQKVDDGHVVVEGEHFDNVEGAVHVETMPADSHV